ncbi:MAG: DUF1772 domain-containing protein [Alphaproteobacteria bacterium]|nr:DUF1772 domain-containing protein [Alphaproteobacteria bacterium]
MPADWIVYVCLFLGLSSALVAGVFQSFSDFVMSGLVRARPAGGIEVMQHINRTVFRSVFLFTFLALAPVSIAAAVYAGFAIEGAAQRFVIAAAIIYIITAFLVTVAGNVPMNNRLDRLDAASAEGAAYWRIYGRTWTRWNHVRMIGSLATAGCYLFAALALA